MRVFTGLLTACILCVCVFHGAVEGVIGDSVFWLIGALAAVVLGLSWLDGALSARSRDWRYENRLVRRPSA